MGTATYHVTDRVPELHGPALRLFRQVGLRGVANVEFKLDERDGVLKLIECNARFTGATPLLTASGYDLGRWVYDRAIGAEPTRLGSYPSGLHQWSPIGDIQAFIQLRRRHELSTRRWLTSLMHRQAGRTRLARSGPSLATGYRSLERSCDGFGVAGDPLRGVGHADGQVVQREVAVGVVDASMSRTRKLVVLSWASVQVRPQVSAVAPNT